MKGDNPMRRNNWYNYNPWNNPYTYGVYKFVLYIHYPDGKIEEQGKYSTWYEAYTNRQFVQEIILKDNPEVKFEISKERIKK